MLLGHGRRSSWPAPCLVDRQTRLREAQPLRWKVQPIALIPGSLMGKTLHRVPWLPSWQRGSLGCHLVVRQLGCFRPLGKTLHWFCEIQWDWAKIDWQSGVQSSFLAIGLGTINVMFYYNGCKTHGQLKYVLHTPTIGTLVLSMSKLDDTRFKCTFGSNSRTLISDGNAFAKEWRCDNLYYVNMDVIHPDLDSTSHALAVTARDKSTDLSMWHRRLGLLGESLGQTTCRIILGKRDDNHFDRDLQ